MSMITVRNLKPETHQKLREQAAAHGRSMEAEARALIETGVNAESESLLDAFAQFSRSVRPTQDELGTIFPPRSSETQRSIALDGDKSS